MAKKVAGNTISDSVLDRLPQGSDPQALFSNDGLMDQLKKRLAERVLSAGLDHHLEQANEAGNHRNGFSRKTVMSDAAKLEIEVPRDRRSAFEPLLIAKYQRRFPGFDEKIVSMYARGMTAREIQGHLREIYGFDASPDLVSAIADAVLEDAAEWQNRPLDCMYPLIFFDAIRVEIRDNGLVRNKGVYLALGVKPDGTKEILGLWIEQSEGAKFWLKIMNELRNRGIEDVPIAVRRIMYATNAIESLNSTVRRAVRTRGHFPSDEAATKLIYLVLRGFAQNWKMPAREWYAAKTQFAVMFGDRMKAA